MVMQLSRLKAAVCQGQGVFMCLFVHMCVFVCMCVFVRMCVFMCMCMCMCMCVFVCMCMCMWFYFVMQWNKVVAGPGKRFFNFWSTSRPVVPQHGKHARLATYSDKLVAVWYDGKDVTKMMGTSDLQTWHSIDLPSEYSKLQAPSLASHGGMLYMCCVTLSKSTNRWVRSILQYLDTPDNGDGGGSGGDGGQWTKLTYVPSHCRHAWCTLNVCADAISLYGGQHGGPFSRSC